MIIDYVLNKVENPLESWCNHRQYHHFGASHLNESISALKSPIKEAEKGKSSEFDCDSNQHLLL